MPFEKEQMLQHVKFQYLAPLLASLRALFSACYHLAHHLLSLRALQRAQELQIYHLAHCNAHKPPAELQISQDLLCTSWPHRLGEQTQSVVVVVAIELGMSNASSSESAAVRLEKRIEEERVGGELGWAL